MKGIILAGGTGSRLLPLTSVISKHLLPVYDKPMIFYPLSVLMLGGIREILIISMENDLPLYKNLFGDGSKYGLSIKYALQSTPRGIADAFNVGRDFINGEKSSLILGDNIFWGNSLTTHLESALVRDTGVTLFAYRVSDPERFGVVEFDNNNNALSIEEKPKEPKSNFAVTGLYFYDDSVSDRVKDLKPSLRGELEITDLNNHYLDNGDIYVQPLGRGFAWLDTGTHKSLLEASSFVETIETRQGFKIACLEEIAFKKNLINSEEFEKIISSYGETNYANYLKNILENKS